MLDTNICIMSRAVGRESLVVVTNDPREFARMPGVRCADWI